MGKTLAQSKLNPVPDHADGERIRSASSELKESREHLFSLFRSGKVSDTFQEDYSEIIDQYFRVSIQESETGQDLFKQKHSFALIAVGGYGRKEMCIYSDIDILILFSKKISPEAKTLAEELFYPMWDVGLDLGYGVRTVKDCLTLGRNDFEVLTSLLDGRFICGDSLLYLTLMEDLHKKVIKKNATSLNLWFENLDKIRMNTFGDASHLLEPNLKDGKGGLRDYHQILWTAKAFFNLRDPKELEYIGKLSYKEYQELEESIKFILLVRNHLHQLTGRKNDRLSFEYQEEIAGRLGYKNLKKIPAVERFLGELHRCMESIKTLHRPFLNVNTPKKDLLKGGEPKEVSKGIHLYQRELGFNSATAILDDPFLLMEIFEQSCRLGNPLSIEARRLVKEFLYLVDDGFRSSGKAVQGFLDIISAQNTFDTLDQMFETGFLDAFIPELGNIRDRVQFDAYHIFPVGRHVLETVYNLKSLSQEKDLLLLDTFADIPNHEPLILAGLFHDIGKTGRGHARRGVRITRKILERFGYPKKWADEILFQIGHHLFLVETATRRDLNDEKVIIQAARTIGSINRLKTLYLLTWADSKATGPRAWNEWIANLVQELFFKILHILEKGELANPTSAQKVGRMKAKLRRETAGSLSPDKLETLFEIMSPRYMLNIPPKDILSHIEMVDKLEEDLKENKLSAFVLDVQENRQGGAWTLSLVAKDRPGLFSDIAGIMALNSINILSSSIYTWRNGTAVDIFSVTRPLDSIQPEATWRRVENGLKNIFSGKLSLPYRLSQKAKPTILSGQKKPSRPPEVVIDNNSSDFFTLIEVFASDRVGLLYLITRTLFDLRLDIRIAMTGVKGDQIADVFYVHDLEGQKLEDEEQVNEITKALLHQLMQE